MVRPAPRTSPGSKAMLQQAKQYWKKAKKLTTDLPMDRNEFTADRRQIVREVPAIINQIKVAAKRVVKLYAEHDQFNNRENPLESMPQLEELIDMVARLVMNYVDVCKAEGVLYKNHAKVQRAIILFTNAIRKRGVPEEVANSASYLPVVIEYLPFYLAMWAAASYNPVSYEVVEDLGYNDPIDMNGLRDMFDFFTSDANVEIGLRNTRSIEGLYHKAALFNKSLATFFISLTETGADAEEITAFYRLVNDFFDFCKKMRFELNYSCASPLLSLTEPQILQAVQAYFYLELKTNSV
jgi:hypothetical protein